MTQTRTRLTTDIDFDRPGRQLGHLRLVHSDDRHAFGVIPIPISVLAGGAGPSVLLTAGTHGDEYEGQAILHELIRTLDPAVLTGRLIVLPALNYPAVMAGARVSPLDGGNLNRAFPGEADAGPTSAIAHYVTSELLPRVQGAADLHSGGTATRYVTSVYLHGGGDRELRARKLAGAKAFGAPYTVCAMATSDARSMSAQCDRMGIPMVATELSGAASIDRAALAIGRAGTLRLLRHFGVLRAAPQDGPFHATRLIAPKGAVSSIMTPIDGVFEPLVELGEQVSVGQTVARVHPIGEIERASIELAAPHDGIVMVRRSRALVARGDHLYRFAVDFAEADYLA
jgi:predicted deacylase